VTLVVDTGPLLASLDRKDQHHRACAALLRGTQGRVVIPSPILVEVDYWCGGKGLALAFDELLRDVRRGAYEVEEVSPTDRDRILELRATYRDLRVGYVDAAVLTIVERLGERKLATLDRRHFGVMRPRHVAALELLPAPR
jgi:uncharacterized protein